MKRRADCLLITATALVAAMGLSSCIYEGEGYCPDNLPFTIDNDWSEADDASPGGMAYIFFPDDGSVPWRYDFPGRDAGEVDMNIGSYRFLSYNDDTYRVRFRDDGGYDGYEAYTDEAALPAAMPRSGDETVRACPDMMWGCAYCAFSLGYDGVAYSASATDASADNMVFSSQYVLTARERQLTARYTFLIEDIVNLAAVKSMSAALSGMAGSMKLASGARGDYPSTLSFKAAPAGETAVAGEFCTFGIPEAPDAGNVLSFFIVIKDGRRFCFRYDVTGQVRAAPDPMNVHIVVKGPEIELPEPDDDTAFDVSVDGWETIVVNIRG